MELQIVVGKEIETRKAIKVVLKPFENEADFFYVKRGKYFEIYEWTTGTRVHPFEKYKTLEKVINISIEFIKDRCKYWKTTLKETIAEHTEILNKVV